MIQKLKLIIRETGKDTETVLEETVSDPSLLYKSIEEFRLNVNAVLTKLIEESGDIEEGAEDSNSENDEEEISLNHKRKKKKM